MSQHFFDSSYLGQPVGILMGWDRPLQGFFMVIGFDDDSYLYSNLNDPDLLPSGGFANTLDYFCNKLAGLGLSVPARMIAEIKADAAANVGNREIHYDTNGSLTFGSSAWEATCIGCGCTDTHACWDEKHQDACHWLEVIGATFSL